MVMAVSPSFLRKQEVLPMAVGSTFTVWAWLLLFGGGGLPLPLSLPPLPEDPVMSAVAPDECLWYLTWSGSAKADSTSKNQTEQLLAEEEIQRFGSEIERRLVAALREHSRGPEAIAAQEVPKLVKIALTRPMAMFVSDFKMGQHGPDIKGGLIINLGEQADDAKTSIDRLTALLPAPPAAAGKWQQMPTPPGAPVVEWGIEGKYLIVGIGEGSADGIAAREKGTAPKWLEAIRRRLKVERPAMVHYLNIKKIVALVQAAGGLGRGAPPQLLETLGISNLTSLASMSGLEGSGWTSNMLLGMDGPPSGIFALTGGDPLTAADLASIPKDATFALAARVDLERVYRGISSMTGKIEPRARLEMEQGIAQVENHLGVDLSRDIFKALGDTWCVYSAPSEGGLLVTGLTVVAPIRDRDRLVKAEERLRTMAKAAMGFAPGAARSFERRPTMTINDFEFRGQQVHFLNFIGEPIPVAPAWCITDKEFIVSLSPQTIKAHLSRKANAGSLADLPDVAKLLHGSGGPTYIGYADTATTVRTLYPLVQFGFEAIASALQQEGIQIDVSIFPSAAAVLPHLEPSVSTAMMAKDGLFVTRHGTLPMEFESLPLIGMPFWLLARHGDVQRTSAEARPSVSVQDFPLLPGAAEKTQSSNNLKQFALAMHNFHSAYRTFPAAYSTSKDGKPLLSWRVQILPYIEESRLYEEFHLDEPWDSEHNKQLIPRMPKIYAAPGSKAAREFKTNYLVPRGDETIFNKGKKPRIQDITDGTSNTIMIVEASDERAVTWTKPDDYEFDGKQPMAGLVGLRRGGFLAAFADGSVRFLKDTIKGETLKALFTRAGGEVIDSAEF
jgi:hypothetical protein